MADEPLSASLEDYLEAIFHIIEQKQAARAKDISKRMKVNGSSVTGALRALAERELVNYAPYDIVTLTPKGKEFALDIVRRHEVLHEFFVKVLGVDEAEAQRAACEMEHAVSRSILERFIEFVEFMEACPRAGAKWLRTFGEQCRESVDYGRCEACARSAVADAKTRAVQAGAAVGEAVVALDAVEMGQKAMVLRVNGRKGVKTRMSELGVAPGTLVEVESRGSGSDPVDIKVKGYHHSLNREDAAGVRVELLQEL